MKLSDLLRNAGIPARKFENDPEITGICPDSARIVEGNLFVAIEGLHVDGHRFLDDAIRRGAAAAVVSESAVKEGRADPERLAVPCVVVPSARRAVARLFAAWYGNPQQNLRIVGVTGTNGKTSVTRLIYELLNRSGIYAGLIGTVGCLTKKGRIEVKPHNNEANMTTPDPEELYKILYLMEREGVEIAVMEVTSHALLLEKTEPIDFDVAVFTNLTEDHLDLHENMENYFAAKARLFEKCQRAVINLDDRYGRRLAHLIGCPVYSCSGEGREAGFVAEDVHQKGLCGIEYKLVSHALRMRVRSPLSGGFNVMNTMEAAVAAHLLGTPVREIQTALATLTGAEGRLERLKLGEKVDFSVFIDYAHTPDALESLLRTVRSFCEVGQRIVLVFGCGGDRDRQKRPLMGRIATAMADLVIVTEDNSRSERTSDIIADILAGASEDGCYTVIDNRREAIEYAIKNARRGDIILLAGKGHENYEIGANGKKPFSEKEIVSAMIEKYY
ncbi:MAG: UDP-N-acetylmuramoyl-L-alanyl-D-glutamate--2,6-diaminopimelate ligase [Clostridia bacterium]|nr:UDP-N-acetylmuramoyl-L-alanyl-D-glutamate--2,6-diaminopimelate ligase [Clostridia bacterium]